MLFTSIDMCPNLGADRYGATLSLRISEGVPVLLVKGKDTDKYFMLDVERCFVGGLL